MKIESKYNVGDTVYIRRCERIYKRPVIEVKPVFGEKFEYKLCLEKEHGDFWYQEYLLKDSIQEVKNGALLYLQRNYLSSIEYLNDEEDKIIKGDKND